MPISIVLVDDHRAVLWGLERLIESTYPKMQVVGKASSVAEALPIVERLQPDVVLLDLDLGMENGVSAIPHILRSSRSKVLVLTGVRDADTRRAAIAAGASDLVSKEATPEHILTAIEALHSGQGQQGQRRSLAAPHIARPAAKSEEQARIASLTPREQDIVRAICRHPSHTVRNVAEALGISERTLRNHLSSIYDKFAVTGRLELYVFATRHNLLD